MYDVWFSAGRLADVGHPDERHTRRTLRSARQRRNFIVFAIFDLDHSTDDLPPEHPPD